MDAATLAALGREIVYPQWFAWLDIADDPLRSVSGAIDVEIGAGVTGDADLDGYTFQAISSDLVDISDVQHSQSGSETVTAQLSGLPLGNTDLINAVGDKTRWRRREARLWYRLLDPVAFDANGRPLGFTPLPIHSYYSGYMIDMSIDSLADSQIITVSIENYQAMLSEASGLTYLHQSEFDPDDRSAEQTLAAANGMQKAGVSGSFTGGSGGGSSGSGGFNRDVLEQ